MLYVYEVDTLTHIVAFVAFVALTVFERLWAALLAVEAAACDSAAADAADYRAECYLSDIIPLTSDFWFNFFILIIS